MKFPWEDWNEKSSSRARKRSSEDRQPPTELSAKERCHLSADRAVQLSTQAARTGRRSPHQENGGDLTGHLKSTGPSPEPARATVEQSTASAASTTGRQAATTGQMSSAPVTVERPHATAKRTSSRRPPAKSVQSRGTQLDCTPVPFDPSVRLSRASLLTPSAERLPRVLLSRLEDTPLQSASLAWHHYRSPSVVGETHQPPQPEASGGDDKPSGNNVDLSTINTNLRFNGHFPGRPGLASTRLSSLRILLELRMMEVVAITSAIRRAKFQSNRRHQQSNTQLFTGRMPFLSPNQQWYGILEFNVPLDTV